MFKIHALVGLCLTLFLAQTAIAQYACPCTNGDPNYWQVTATACCPKTHLYYYSFDHTCRTVAPPCLVTNPATCPRPTPYTCADKTCYYIRTFSQGECYDQGGNYF